MTHWNRRDLLTPGSYVTRDFQYGLPRKPLEFTEKTITPIGNNAHFEVFDFPGQYAPPFNEKDRFSLVIREGERFTRIRHRRLPAIHRIVGVPMSQEEEHLRFKQPLWAENWQHSA